MKLFKNKYLILAVILLTVMTGVKFSKILMPIFQDIDSNNNSVISIRDDSEAANYLSFLENKLFILFFLFDIFLVQLLFRFYLDFGGLFLSNQFLKGPIQIRSPSRFYYMGRLI